MLDCESAEWLDFNIMRQKSLFLVQIIIAFVEGADLRTLAVDSDNLVQNLAQSAKTEKVVFKADDTVFEPIYEADDPYGIALMLLGALLVPLSQVCLWKNEQRAVKFA